MADVKKCFMCDNARINDELTDENDYSSYPVGSSMDGYRMMLSSGFGRPLSVEMEEFHDKYGWRIVGTYWPKYCPNCGRLILDYIRENSLLHFLLDNGYDVYDDFLALIDDIDTARATYCDYLKDSTVYDEEEISCLLNDIDTWESKLLDIKRAYSKITTDFDWDNEILYANLWWNNKRRCMGWS